MQLNFDSEDAPKKKANWADKELWKHGEWVGFEVLNADLLEVEREGNKRLKAVFTLKVLDGGNEGRETTKDVWDPIANKKSQGFLKHLLLTAGVPKNKLNGGNVPLAMSEAVGGKFKAVCLLENGGKWVNWDDFQPLD